MASPMTMDQAVARRNKLLDDNRHHAVGHQKMKELLLKAKQNVKDADSRLRSCSDSMVWDLERIMGAPLEVLMVEDFKEWELEPVLEAKKKAADLDLAQLEEIQGKMDVVWEERHQKIRQTEDHIRQLLEADPEYVARRDKKRKEEADKAYRERCEQTKARALAGWSWHQDNDRETYEKYRKIFLERQREKEEDRKQAWRAREAWDNAAKAAKTSVAKEVQDWYDLTHKEIKSRYEVSSFPFPPASSTYTDFSCHLKPRPLAPACQCSIRKAFQQISGIDLKKERARWRPDYFSLFPQY